MPQVNHAIQLVAEQVVGHLVCAFLTIKFTSTTYLYTRLNLQQEISTAEAELILSTYQSPLAQFCSGESLIKSLPDGRAR